MFIENSIPSFFWRSFYRMRPNWDKAFWPLISLVINLVCIIVSYILMVGITRENYALKTLSIGSVTLFAFSLHLFTRNTLRDPFHPDILLTTGHLIQFVIPCMIFAMGIFNDIAYIENNHIYQVRFFFPEVLFAVLVGQTLFNIFFCIYPPPKNRAIEQTATSGAAFIVLIVIAVWISRIFILLTDSYFHSRHSDFMFKSVLYSPMATISTMGKIVTAYMAIRFFKSKGIWKEKTAKIYLVFEIAWSLFSGVREDFFITILCIIFGYIIVHRKIPIIYSLIFVFILLIGSTFLQNYRRAMLAQPSSQHVSIISASKMALKTQKKDNSFYALIERLNDGQFTAGCFKSVPESMPFFNGKTYKMIYWIPIPRVIYPDRPKFIINYFNLFRPEITSSSAPVTAIGEAYINFGWLGIPVVFFILGIIFKTVDSIFNHTLSWAKAAILIFFSTLVIRMTVNPAVTQISWILKIIMLLIALKILNKITTFIKTQNNNQTTTKKHSLKILTGKILLRFSKDRTT